MNLHAWLHLTKFVLFIVHDLGFLCQNIWGFLFVVVICHIYGVREEFIVVIHEFTCIVAFDRIFFVYHP